MLVCLKTPYMGKTSAAAHTKPGDRMLNSLWAGELPAFPKLEQDLRTDVLIIGGGLAGLLCAHRLHQDGMDYALIEADRIFRGVSRNTTAKITSQHGLIYDQLIRQFDAKTARLYYRANQEALERYRRLCRSIDCDFETKDNYIYSIRDFLPLSKELASLERLGIPAEFTETLPLPFPVTGAIRFSGQAQFNPHKFVSGLVQDLRIYEHTPARAFAGSTVLTDGGRITAKKVIIATHFPILNKHGMYFLKLYQQRSYVLALEKGPDVQGMYLDGAKNGISMRNYGNLLLLGGGGHRTGKSGGGWTELERFAKTHFSQAREVCRWATQDCMSLDGIPYIGRYSRSTPALYVATGFNKWGMSTSMVAAHLLGDLVQGKENPYAPVFSPQRTMLRTQLLYNGAESAVNLLTPTKPRCPHLGCALKWNAQEHSWDCPCHGSRFTEEGKLLDNPATGDLER